MSTEVHWEAIRESVLLLPERRKLELIRHLTESLLHEEDKTERDRQVALNELRRELAALPVSSPGDGFSNRDHDRLIYGARA